MLIPDCVARWKSVLMVMPCPCALRQAESGVVIENIEFVFTFEQTIFAYDRFKTHIQQSVASDGMPFRASNEISDKLVILCANVVFGYSLESETLFYLFLTIVFKGYIYRNLITFTNFQF